MKSIELLGALVRIATLAELDLPIIAEWVALEPQRNPLSEVPGTR